MIKVQRRNVGPASVMRRCRANVSVNREYPYRRRPTVHKMTAAFGKVCTSVGAYRLRIPAALPSARRVSSGLSSMRRRTDRQTENGEQRLRQVHLRLRFRLRPVYVWACVSGACGGAARQSGSIDIVQVRSPVYLNMEARRVEG